MSASDWHPEDIKAAVRKTGITLADLSETAGFESSAARQALRVPMPRLEALIANRLGLQPKDIWPSRYDATGAPLRGLHAAKRKPTGQKHIQTGQKRAAR